MYYVIGIINYQNYYYIDNSVHRGTRFGALFFSLNVLLLIFPNIQIITGSEDGTARIWGKNKSFLFSSTMAENCSGTEFSLITTFVLY